MFVQATKLVIVKWYIIHKVIHKDKIGYKRFVTQSKEWEKYGAQLVPEFMSFVDLREQMTSDATHTIIRPDIQQFDLTYIYHNSTRHTTNLRHTKRHPITRSIRNSNIIFSVSS